MDLDEDYHTEDEKGIALVSSTSNYQDVALVASDNKQGNGTHSNGHIEKKNNVR